MKFTSIPENHSSACRTLIYEADLGGLRDSVEAAVIDCSDDSVAARLRFSQTDRLSLDIAPCVRRMFDPRPSGLSFGIRADAGRTVRVAVEVLGTRSPERTYTLFELDGLPRLVTTMPETRTIAGGEFAEIPFYAPAGGTITLAAVGSSVSSPARTVSLPAAETVSLLQLSADDFPLDAAGIDVRFASGGRTERIFYDRVARSPESVRLAWLASTGAIEFYTFPTRRKRVLKADKERIYTSGGYVTAGCCSEASMLLVSDFEPRTTISRLEEILTSGRVWRVEGSLFTEVDVVSAETTYRYGGAPATITVEIRTRKREEGLL